ncbi:MAG: phosphatase PAP2 family protein [Alphaproteobacteria bacterium]
MFRFFARNRDRRRGGALESAIFLLRLARREIVLLAVLLVVGAAILGFAEIAEEMVEGDTRALDEAILLALRTAGDLGTPIGPPWLAKAARDVTALGGYTILTFMTLAVIGYQFLIGHRRGALLVAVSIGGGVLLSNALKSFYGRPRPDLVPHAVDVVSLSFPSGHAMLSTVTYLTLGALLVRLQPRWRTKAYLLGCALLLTAAIGASRVFLGVHYPSDVLAGWCVGAAWAMLWWAVALWLQRRGEVETDPVDATGPASQRLSAAVSAPAATRAGRR